MTREQRDAIIAAAPVLELLSAAMHVIRHMDPPATCQAEVRRLLGDAAFLLAGPAGRAAVQSATPTGTLIAALMRED